MTRALTSLVALVALALPARSQDPALALPSLDAGEGLTARVDATSGALTLEEVDVRHGGLTLRRTRTWGPASAPGLFGRGWRSDVDLAPPPGVVVVRRAGTIVVFEDREDGASLELSLDASGRVTRALGYEVDLRYDYDAQGELVRVRDGASGRSRDYAVERAGALRVDGAGGTLLRATRDATGRVVALETPGGARSFAYWPDGASVEAGARRWTHEAGRVEQAWGLGADDVAITRADGPRAIVADTPWGRFGVRRDGGGRAREVHGPFGRVVLERDGRGRRTRLVWPNGVETRVTWGAGARPLAVVHRGPGGVELAAAERDAASGVEERRVVGDVVRVERDEAGRVVAVDGPGRARTSLVYDAGGARRLVERDGALETWTSDGRGRLVAAGDLRLRHDERGRVVEATGPGLTLTCTWDAADRLVRVVRAAPDAPLEAVEYAWTDERRLAARSDRDGVARVVETALVRATLGPGPRRRLEVLDPDDRDAPSLCTFEDGAWTFAHDDGAGDVLARSDAAGDVIAWAASEVDPVTGLVFRAGRPYAPALGRFFSPDPAARGARAYEDGERAGLVGALRRR